MYSMTSHVFAKRVFLASRGRSVVDLMVWFTIHSLERNEVAFLDGHFVTVTILSNDRVLLSR